MEIDVKSFQLSDLSVSLRLGFEPNTLHRSSFVKELRSIGWKTAVSQKFATTLKQIKQKNKAKNKKNFFSKDFCFFRSFLFPFDEKIGSVPNFLTTSFFIRERFSRTTIIHLIDVIK